MKMAARSAVLVAGLTMAATGVGLLGTAAGATTGPPATGVYKGTFSGEGSTVHDVLDMKANLTFTISNGPSGTWSETGTTVTMRGEESGTVYNFSIRQIGADLGSPASPGTIKVPGEGKIGLWYAVPRA
jgi:hypothetical protein